MQYLLNGTLLQGGKYKIEKVLGQGSFGITYLAEHTALGKKVCIKEFFMKEHNARENDGSVSGLSGENIPYDYGMRFQKEAQNLASIDHPNIIRVTDSFRENNTFYYVMDFVEGENLADYQLSHNISETEAIKIIKSVADALICMHEDGNMLHLDLKPANIMRRASDGHILLIDFGLSKHFDQEGNPETSSTIGRGTNGFAPMEQANHKDGDFRPTIDVYAIGATLLRLFLNGSLPLSNDFFNDEDLLPMKLKEAKVSKELAVIITKAMEPKVRDRYQSVREFRNALDGITSDKRTTEKRQQKKKSSSSEETIVISTNKRKSTASEATIVASGNDSSESTKLITDSPRIQRDVEKEEREKVRKKANQIAESYPEAFAEWCTTHSITKFQALAYSKWHQKLIDEKNQLKRREVELHVAKENSFSKQMEKYRQEHGISSAKSGVRNTQYEEEFSKQMEEYRRKHGIASVNSGVRNTQYEEEFSKQMDEYRRKHATSSKDDSSNIGWWIGIAIGLLAMLARCCG